MISFRLCEHSSEVSSLKTAYRKGLTAPLDGMWDTGFTEPSPHWKISIHEDTAGYFVINDEGTLLQFYIHPTYFAHEKACFDQVVALDEVKQAVVSTVDPSFLALCLDQHRTLEVHTLQYERNEDAPVPGLRELPGLEFRPALPDELERIVLFQLDCLSMGSEMSGWLSGYSGNLIDRGEMHILTLEGDWLGLGEFRKSETQPGVVDVGMMVGPTHRGQGWAIDILNRLRLLSADAHLRPICSTTVDNAGAQKAIERAGFRSRHRIMTVHFH